MLLEPHEDTNIRFSRLSPKERELLDQILRHKSLKVIAHDLGVTLSAVDQRLKSARIKLGAADRNDAARIYSDLLASHGGSASGAEAHAKECQPRASHVSEPAADSTFTFQDRAMIEVVPPWFDRTNRGAVAELLDQKFGRLWRVVVIPILSVAIAMLALALLAMAKSLSELL